MALNSNGQHMSLRYNDVEQTVHVTRSSRRGVGFGYGITKEQSWSESVGPQTDTCVDAETLRMILPRSFTSRYDHSVKHVSWNDHFAVEMLHCRFVIVRSTYMSAVHSYVYVCVFAVSSSL